MAKTPETYLIRNKKNYIINSNMEIAQRGTSFVSAADNTFGVDRFVYRKTGAMVHTVAQDTDVPTFAQSKYTFKNSLALTLTTPDTAIATTDLTQIIQNIEGYNFTNLAQKPFTLSFWVKATTPGTYCVAFRNAGPDRSYVAEYSINASNTWEYKSITVSASPIAGTWNYVAGLGLSVSFVLTAGSNFQTTANTWNTGNFLCTANQVNGVNTGATSFKITGVMLNQGPVALDYATFGGDFAGELRACQRYYEKSYNLTTALGSITYDGSLYGTASGTDAALGGRSGGTVYFKVTKRLVTSIITLYNPLTGATASYRDNTASINITSGFDVIGQSAMRLNSSGSATGNAVTAHWTADSEF